MVEPMYFDGIPADSNYEHIEYSPAPGQFINKTPEAVADDTPETMRKNAEEALTGGSMISLGGFGGYVVFGFDHVVVNRQDADFTVLGNAFVNSAEPGIIQFSVFFGCVF